MLGFRLNLHPRLKKTYKKKLQCSYHPSRLKWSKTHKLIPEKTLQIESMFEKKKTYTLETPMVLKLQQVQKSSRKIKKTLTYKSYGGPAIAMWRPRLCRRSLVPSGAGWQSGWQAPPFPRKWGPRLQDIVVRWLDTTCAQPLGGCRFYVVPCRFPFGCPAS